MELDNYFRNFKLLCCIFNHSQTQPKWKSTGLILFCSWIFWWNLRFIIADSILTDSSDKVSNQMLLNWKESLIENYYLKKVQIINNRWRTESADEVKERIKRGGATYRNQNFAILSEKSVEILQVKMNHKFYQKNSRAK